MNTKVLKSTSHVLKLTYNSAVIKQWQTYLLSVSIITQQTSHAKKANSQQSRLHYENDWKTGTSYMGARSSEAVSTLCDEKFDHQTLLETVLLLAKYDNILKCHLENVIEKCLQNKPDKHKHNRANRNIFISNTTVNSIIAIILYLS